MVLHECVELDSSRRAPAVACAAASFSASRTSCTACCGATRASACCPGCLASLCPTPDTFSAWPLLQRRAEDMLALGWHVRKVRVAAEQGRTSNHRRGSIVHFVCTLWSSADACCGNLRGRTSTSNHRVRFFVLKIESHSSSGFCHVATRGTSHAHSCHQH